MRVYHDVPATNLATSMILSDLQQKFEDVLDLCYAGDLPRYGNMLGILLLITFKINIKCELTHK
jgi:hypothetical protein